MGGRTTPLVPSSRVPEFRAPLTIPGGEIAGAEVVRELPDAFALPVWQTLRSVLAWAGGEPGMRGDLFEAQAMAEWEEELLRGEWEEALRLPLAVIVGAMVEAERASPELLARSCMCVTEWALSRGAVTTGLAFAEAAALTWPEQPRYAYMVGRLLRKHERVPEAEQWMRRVVRVAGSIGDRDAETLGLNSLGNVHFQAGRYNDAIRVQKQALRKARKYDLPDREGEILHDLFTASSFAGEVTTADEHARGAFEIYKYGHPRLPALAHDVAFSWVLKGHYGRALAVLRELPAFFADEGERVRVLGSVARAAGGCGALHAFDQAEREVWEIIGSTRPLYGMASALVELSIGATGVGRWSAAERALELAVEIAASRFEADVLARADQTLSLVRARRAADHARHSLDTEPIPKLDSLAEGFVSTLLAGAAV